MSEVKQSSLLTECLPENTRKCLNNSRSIERHEAEDTFLKFSCTMFE